MANEFRVKNGLIVSGNATVSGIILDGNTITGVDDSGEFTDDDAHIMTSAGINDKFGVIAGSTSIVTVGTITTGTWNGTAIAGGYIANDAIDSQHYADGSIDTAHIADNQVTLAKMAGLARGKIIYGDSNGDPAALALGSNGQVLTTDGTDISWGSAGGGATALNGLTDVISNITNFTDSILISPDGAAPPHGTLNGATENIGIGKDVLSALTSADYSTFVGSKAGEDITTGSYNTGFGRMTLYQVTTQTNNTAVGYFSGAGIQNGGNNTAIGTAVLGADNSASQNTGVGSSALRNTTANNNTAVGYRALYGNTSGQRNIAIGVQALDSATTETDNIAIGHETMYNPNGGDKNVAIGNYSLDALTSGNNNVAYGHQAASAVNSGSNNITIGYQAGDNITTGSRCLVIGGLDTSSASQDDAIRIGNGDGSVTWINGDQNGIRALKIKVQAVTGATTLTDAQSGSYIYCTGSGVPTLPASAESGQQYTIINNTGGNLSVGLNSNSIIPSGHADMANQTARTYVAIASGTWYSIG